jgi:hypothetical protein
MKAARTIRTPVVADVAPLKERKKPDFTGVPGALVASDVVAGLEGQGLVWGTGHRTSPYDAMLEDLRRHTESALAKGEKHLPALRFDDARARASVCARAKKKGLRAICAEHAGKLYVRLDKLEGNPSVARRKAILVTLKQFGPLPTQRLAGQLRQDGDTAIDAATVNLICAQMVKSGEVIAQEGGAWSLSPAAIKRAS